MADSLFLPSYTPELTHHTISSSSGTENEDGVNSKTKPTRQERNRNSARKYRQKRKREQLKMERQLHILTNLADLQKKKINSLMHENKELKTRLNLVLKLCNGDLQALANLNSGTLPLVAQLASPMPMCDMVPDNIHDMHSPMSSPMSSPMTMGPSTPPLLPISLPPQIKMEPIEIPKMEPIEMPSAVSQNDWSSECGSPFSCDDSPFSAPFSEAAAPFRSNSESFLDCFV